MSPQDFDDIYNDNNLDERNNKFENIYKMKQKIKNIYKLEVGVKIGDVIRQFEEIQQDIRKKKNVSELNPNKKILLQKFIS